MNYTKPTKKMGRTIFWIVILMFYVASHLVLSRASAPQINSALGVEKTFLYSFADPNAVFTQQRLQTVHLILRGFFYPVWQIDHRLFGGPWPMWSMPMMSISVEELFKARPDLPSLPEFYHPVTNAS